MGIDGALKTTDANVRMGRYVQDGYHYLASVDISVQGQDSNECWRNSLSLAERLNVPIEVEFRWRHKKGATHPGENGLLKYEARIYLLERRNGQWDLRRQGVDLVMESADSIDQGRDSAHGRLRGFAPCNLRVLTEPFEEWRLEHLDERWVRVE